LYQRVNEHDDKNEEGAEANADNSEVKVSVNGPDRACLTEGDSMSWHIRAFPDKHVIFEAYVNRRWGTISVRVGMRS